MPPSPQSASTLHAAPSGSLPAPSQMKIAATAPGTTTSTEDALSMSSWGAIAGAAVAASSTESFEGSRGSPSQNSTSTTGVVPLWGETSKRMAAWWTKWGQPFEKLDYNEKSPILVCTGFVATSKDGVPTTLKRSGSDYSATIFAKLLGASRVTMWKNTNGVYTADPRRVPEAFPIESLKYDEAMELAYFGAQVLHPSAMLPCIDDNIPVYVRNIFNPSFEGTVIEGRSDTLAASWGKVEDDEDAALIKGITSIDDASLLTLEGASLAGGASGPTSAAITLLCVYAS